ncbi:tetratricopeptide repeat protein [Salegentibacter maritimus]|uniref:Tetratricopeptide repeat-containing protein n=1 Tax=Salegentibacter maritimus TaxID=2794347 RepID=A0ABS0TIF4_9FLAO|nr:hypothetical protein [Salegentibacter maritimus]MBI6120844.1 hypothetical protein [Salegentibacter maritimus]
MSLRKEEVIQHIERAEQLYKANLYKHLTPHISAVQENFEALDSATEYARYYRLVMLYIAAFEEINMPVMQSYLEALEAINEIQASDYEVICSCYHQCPGAVYEKALMQYPYNETLHLHYALKLQNEKRFLEAIGILKYILECYPATTEARLLLWEIETAYLEELCCSTEEANCYELLDLASATHNLEVLKGLELDERLDEASKSLIYIQIALWEKRSVEILEYWKTEWKLLELSDRARYLLADYARAFMMYNMVSQILRAPSKPEFPTDEFTSFQEYKEYMKAVSNSGWQLAQHHYLLVGNSAYFHTGDRKVLNICVEQGLALNPKNPLLLVLKAKSFYLEENYNQTAAAYHEAYRNGLAMSEYLFYLLEVNNRIQSWQGILDIVTQFHKRKSPTLKTMFFKARALVMLQEFDAALEVINEALQDFPLPAHSYAPWFYNLRMLIHKRNHNYKAFLEDMHEEINYYKIGDSDYCSTMNMCVETIFEMGDYEECYKFAIYNYEQEQLSPELYPVLQWLCFYDFLIEKPDDLNDVTENDLIEEPTTFIDYRNNGLLHWIMGNHDAATASLELAAGLTTNKAYYLKLALTCSKEAFHNSKSIRLCETIKKELPESQEWKIDFDYANLLREEKQYKAALHSFKQVLQGYPDHSFFQFPKDDNHVMLRSLKECAKELGDIHELIKYNAMLLSKDNPSINLLKEHQEITNEKDKQDIFVRHNLLEGLFQLGTDMSKAESDELIQIKTKIRTNYFAERC